MYVPESSLAALTLTILSAVFWGSWANTSKGTRAYPFALYYWDYIFGVLLCAIIFALTLGSTGQVGEPFFENLMNADRINWGDALVAGIIFNIANLLLVAAIDIAGLTIAFPIAIGIAVVEGVLLSYLIQPKGSAIYLSLGVLLALLAVLFNARAYRALNPNFSAGNRASSVNGVAISVVSGVLMGAFAPFVTQAMTSGHALTPYSVAVLFAIGAVGCSLVVNVYFMRHPMKGAPSSFAQYRQASARNHLLGLLGGITWGIGGCFNFIAAGLVGVPISYAIGQSAPLIAAFWGVFVWQEFAGAPRRALNALTAMFVCYVAAISLIALAYNG